jgi:CheY-like chemotaxis protein
MSRVLVVDDDAVTLETLALGLRESGHTVSVAPTGRAALVAIRPPPDVLLLDLNLPDIDGFEVLRRIRERRLKVPTVTMTGYYLDFDPKQASALGAAEHLRKPIFLDDLLPVIARLSAVRAPDGLAQLHARLITGDTDARERAAEELLRRVPRRLHCAFPRADVHEVDEAVQDAILEYLRSPNRFNPTRCDSLTTFIFAAAWRNLANAIKGETQRKAREAAYANLQPTASRTVDSSSDRLGEQILAHVLAGEPDASVRAALSEWLAGDRSNHPFVRVRHLCRLGPEELARESKRYKDAFVKRVLRFTHGDLHRGALFSPTAQVEFYRPSRNSK